MSSSDGGEYAIRGDFPGPVAEAFFYDRSEVSMIRGCLGSGKTTSTILKLLALAELQLPNADGIRPSRLVVLRNTYSQLISTSLKDFRALTHPLGEVTKGHVIEGTLRWSLEDETQVELNVLFLALDRDDDQVRLKGVNASFFWLNEVCELPRAALIAAQSRTGRYPSTPLAGAPCSHGGFVVGDTNAPAEDHWYADYEKRPPPGWAFFTQPPGVLACDKSHPDAIADFEKNFWRPNPDAENLANLRGAYYRKQIGGNRTAWVKIMLANELGSIFDGKPVFHEFKLDIHVREFEVDTDATILYGVDFGLTPAAALGQVHDGTLWIFDEVVTANFSAADLAREMKALKAGKYPALAWGDGWGDPANPRSQADKKTPIDVLVGAGFSINTSPVKGNDPTIRRDAVGHRLLRLAPSGVPQLVIHPRCRVLIEGMSGGYRYERRPVNGRAGEFFDAPNKNMYSHVNDALQYLCVGLGDVAIITRSTSGTDWTKSVNQLRRRKNTPARRGPGLRLNG